MAASLRTRLHQYGPAAPDYRTAQNEVLIEVFVTVMRATDLERNIPASQQKDIYLGCGVQLYKSAR